MDLEEVLQCLRAAEAGAKAESERAKAETEAARERAERAELRTEQAETRAERAETRAEQAETRAERAETRAERAERETRHTNLDEYLEACHDLVYTRFKVETDPKKTTKGTIRAYDKFLPKHLRPWTDFLARQKEIMTTVYSSFPTQERLFDHRAYLSVLGDKVAPIADEKMLEGFLHLCVEDPVRCIIHELCKSGDFQQQLYIGHGIKFENHLKAISGTADEVERDPQQPPASPLRQPEEPEQQRPKTPDPVEDPPTLNADQICIYRYEEEGLIKRSVIAVSEYKPPHKLSVQQLRVGLHEMNIFEDIVCRNKIPTEEGAKFQHYSEELSAAAVVQTYHYMIKAGLSYSLLTTGEAIVFLKIDWEDPETLYYHLAEPGPEVTQHGEYRSCTAVAQYLAFHLLALSNRSWSRQDYRRQVIKGLERWNVSFRKAASEAGEANKAPDTSPAFIPSTYPTVDRSVKPRRSRRLNLGTEPGNDKPAGRKDPEHSGSDDNEGPHIPDTPSPAERRQRSEGGGARRSGRIAAQNQRKGENRDSGSDTISREEMAQSPHEDLEYCTQKCLLGLLRGSPVDLDCPNLMLHNHRSCERGGSNASSRASKRHPISHDSFLKLLSDQLKETLDYGITSLDITGARGALFKVTLLTYGYTFISKGTVEALIPYLRYEAVVYKRLEPIQGIAVPVFLGAIDLRPLDRTYYYDIRVDIVHLSFLSWGGVDLREAQDLTYPGGSLEEMALKSMEKVHRQGVVHKDARRENLLFNPQTQGVMVIDFERSLLPSPPRRQLAVLEPNKRQRVQNSAGQTKVATRPGNAKNQLGQGFLNDLAGVRGAFV
ncbi:hypothetical protein TOPH_08162 [Tolypocladium ophioglossoides CBS 100239]|uniref:Protein kinase domain-containing protein n=1 Tax=Tolypocladium ophioglossoides (strain CBS 100239) TaxID=1163406 RepID=A0A0L0MZ75_TOLOC|nr:hypothetical protein TOPH_08162 [Tolypocladium ophioglossoides CBS 100239]